jgi:predicted ATPase with chaperone activity
MSHRAEVLFSQNKSATNNQSAVLFSHNKPAPAISHQPTEQAATLNTVQRQQYCAHLACFLEERLDCFSEVI